MNIKSILLAAIAIISCGCNLIHAKGMLQKNHEPKKSIFNIFKPKNNQLYITFQTAGYFCSNDPDEKVLGQSYLYMAQRAYPRIKINKQTLFDAAVVFDAKKRLVENFYYLVPHQIVEDLKNGETIPIQIGKKPISVVVQK